MKQVFLLLIILAVLATPTHAQPRKTISRPELEDILSHSITVALLNDYCKTPDGFYPGTSIRIVAPEEMTPPGSDHTQVANLLKEDRASGKTFARYREMLRLIRQLRPRLITDAVTQWGAWDWHTHMARCRATVADIKAIAPDIVVQASVNEYVDKSTVKAVGNIPAWVWEAFGIPDEHRWFDIHRMMFADWARQDEPDVPQRWWSYVGTEEGLPAAIVPDIRTREAQMWMYYQGRVFMDMGCESISFSQVELMNNQTREPTHWAAVFEKLRAYADAQPALRYVLMTGHTNGMADAAGNLLFDFHISPTRPSELGINVDAAGGDCEITAATCGWDIGAGKIYRRSLGGRAPSGWWCTSLPGQVFIDNYGAGGPLAEWGKPADDACGIYHFDEITWFALQDKAYRDHWLRYAYHRVHQLDPNIYFALPVKRGPTCRDYWYPADYLANNPAPGLLDPPATIHNIPDGDVDRDAVQLYAGYGQEDVIQELLLAGPSAATPSGIMRMSPNPAVEWLDVSLTQPGPGSRVNYVLTNTVGAQAASGSFRGTKHRIDVASLPRGFYILTVWDGGERHATKVSLQ